MTWWKRKVAAAIVDPPRVDSTATAEKSEGMRDSGSWFKNMRIFGGQTQKGKPKVGNTEPVFTEQSSTSVVLEHGPDLIAFDLNWQLLRQGELRKLQTQALADGYSHQVVGVEGDLVGFFKRSPTIDEKRPMFSAALLLAETFSLGGDEVFVFALDDARYAMVALKNSMPVPGFDLVGSASSIAEVAQNYLNLPHKNEVRRCGDASILSGAEFFDFSAALAALDQTQPRIKKIPDLRNMMYQGAIAVSVILLVGVAWMGWSYYQAKVEAERLQRESDPNILYEQAYTNSVASIKTMGTSGLKAMSAVLMSLPMEVGGWGLSNVACQVSECVATWTRQFGNYADFDANLPDGTGQKPEYGFYSSDVKGIQLKTRHPVVLEKAFVSRGLNRDQLPLTAQVQADFVSRLQDYSLIDVQSQISPPVPFPAGVSDIAPIFKPVVSGAWSLNLPLWTLESVTVPDYVHVDSLVLDLPVKADGARSAWTFKLTGKYYAKGKSF
jgi:Pilin accessory protein (PilO)